MEENKTPAPQAAKPRYQRRIIFIKKALQFRYMFLIVISVVIGIAITGFEVLSTLQHLYAEYPGMLLPLYGKFGSIALTIGLKICVFLVLVVLFSAILSHKMAGPIYNFERTCREIAKGDFSKRVRLRQGDNMTDLQKEFNEMMDVLETEIKKGKGEK